MKKKYVEVSNKVTKSKEHHYATFHFEARGYLSSWCNFPGITNFKPFLNVLNDQTFKILRNTNIYCALLYCIVDIWLCTQMNCCGRFGIIRCSECANRGSLSDIMLCLWGKIMPCISVIETRKGVILLVNLKSERGVRFTSSGVIAVTCSAMAPTFWCKNTEFLYILFLYILLINFCSLGQPKASTFAFWALSCVKK